MKSISSKFAVLPIALLLSACGGGSDSTAPVSAPQASAGSLTSSVIGLPTGVNANMTLTGPNDFSITFDGTSILNELAYGDYTLTINSISTNQGLFDSIPNSAQVTVDGNETVEVLYQTELLTQGTVTGFGSLVVNGVRFDTDGAIINSHNGEISQNALDLGMVVNIVGRTTADSEIITAQNISYFAAAEGPITDISFGQNSFTVLGQVFSIDANTRFIDRRFDQLRIGDVIEVSAVGNTQNLAATRVEYYAQPSDDYDVTGFVSNLSTSASTFTIGGLTIRYSSADVDGSLIDGALVSVEARALPVDGVWLVDDVDVLRANSSDTSGRIVLESIVTDANSNQVLLSNGTTITIDDQTSFINVQRDEITAGQRVVINAAQRDGVFIATQVSQIKESLVQAKGMVTERDNNEIRINGKEFDVNTATQIVDTRVVPALQINVTDIFVGDYVDVRGFYDEDNDLIASQIQIVATSDGSNQNRGGLLEIEGRLTALERPEAMQSGTLVINGLTIRTQAITQFFFDDRFVDAETFFARLEVNDLLDVDARILDGEVVAYEVEREDDTNTTRGLFEIEGNISKNLANGRFDLGGLTIVVDENTRFEDGNESALITGAYAEVKATEDTAGNIVAVVVDFESRDNSDGERELGEVEIEGRIADFVGQDTFTINGQEVLLMNDTDFENGDRNSLRNDLWVEVDGFIDRDGALQADYVYIEENREDDIEGNITAIIDVNQFVVGGITIELTNRTEFEGGRRSDLTVGRLIEIEGKFTSQNRFIAVEVYFKG